MKNASPIIFIALLSAFSLTAYSQPQDSLRLSALQAKLEQVARTDTTYNEKLDISVTNMPISELLQYIGKASGLNINVEAEEGRRASCNFKQVRIVDIIFFLCKEHSLEVESVGNILSVHIYKAPVWEPPIHIQYHPEEKTVSYEFTDAKLIDVTKRIAESSGVNIIIPQVLFEQRVSAYGNSMQIEEAVPSIAAVNALATQKKSETTWAFYKEESGAQGNVHRNVFQMDNLKVDSLGLITAKLTNANIQHIIPDVCQRLNINYFLTENMDHPTGISVENVDFNSFLKVLFTGTNFTWRLENGIYIFGKTGEGKSLSAVRVLPMKYRTVDKVPDIIPAELKRGMEIISFPDLNSLVISGDQRNVMQIMAFLNDIDKSVPLISIDIIIVDATDTSTRETGISMGLGTNPAVTSGSLSPGVDFTLGANAVNKLINTFNGFGSINIGKVKPNFYMGLKLLEEDGKIYLRSTPRLSTLNGHKATLKSGEMKYYKESQTNIIGTQNPLQTESYLWKNVEANLSLDITPYVSLDSCITLQINLTQSEFTERETADAPPGTTTRSFNSIIKVRNQEMVLLGGIERNMSSSTGKGLPFIARIPILRSIFGSSSRKKSMQKLNVFIKPTIIE